MTPRSRDLIIGFAANLRRLMDRRNIGIPELAGRSELPPHRIEQFLNAKEEAGAIEVMRLAAALRAQPGDLFEGLVWIVDDTGHGEYRYEGGNED